jgi:hypothetical protein
MKGVLTEAEVKDTLALARSPKPKIAIGITGHHVTKVLRLIEFRHVKHPLYDPSVAILDLNPFNNAIPMNDPTVTLSVYSKV